MFSVKQVGMLVAYPVLAFFLLCNVWVGAWLVRKFPESDLKCVMLRYSAVATAFFPLCLVISWVKSLFPIHDLICNSLWALWACHGGWLLLATPFAFIYFGLCHRRSDETARWVGQKYRAWFDLQTQRHWLWWGLIILCTVLAAMPYVLVIAVMMGVTKA